MRTLAASIVLLTASTVLAGPDWTEGVSGEATDARKNPPGQLIAFALRDHLQVETILGGLNGGDIAGGADVADVYRLTTIVPNTIVKTGPFGGTREANFDTVLALFTMSGLGIVANDDVGPGDSSSAITIPTPGTYLVAVAVKGVQPISTGGNIFNFTQPGAQFAQVPANGPGAALPLQDWAGTPVPGTPRNYLLRFQAAVVPTVSEMGLIALGGAFVIGAVVVLRRGAFVG